MHIQSLFCAIVGLQSIVLVSGVVPGENSKILKYESEGVNSDGSYRWSYEADNGIAAQEQAHVKESGSLGVQGSYQYTAPGNIPVSIVYIADENGFQVQGNVLPEPPPIPPWILRALEWNAAHPEEEEEEENRIRQRKAKHK
ncbi:hypothetical protein PPYR_08378 [Photinus pyralis]|uniref:Uncharacterized protein n=1 Tax=Photinus pyralis TaxID=7054 RepID=A0A1Y1M8L0_PHOPY|nr:endocuticle structural glycoprotein SgAbd-1-like [Photinus pyralis]KAB0797384.1 hypothetical protein PPYR_08378 [Photinus pyralis]